MQACCMSSIIKRTEAASFSIEIPFKGVEVLYFTHEFRVQWTCSAFFTTLHPNKDLTREPYLMKKLLMSALVASFAVLQIQVYQ